jgi:hypothetical protein
MISRWRAPQIVVLAVLASAVTRPADARPQAGSLIAEVLDDVTGLTIPSASVRISNSSGVTVGESPVRTAVRLSEGNYLLTPGAEGYLWTGAPVQIGISAGLPRSVQLRLSRPGVLTGRVLDADSRAVRDAFVIAIPATANALFLGSTAGSLPVTNESGEFRVTGLPSGKYYLLTLPSGTWFPRGTESETAVPVLVQAGQESGGMDIHVVDVRTVCVHGEVRGHSSIRGPLTLTLQPVVRGPARPTVPADFGPSGQFSVCSVQPGTYVLRAEAGSWSARIPVDVPETDLTVLPIDLQQRRAVTGRVRGKWAPGLRVVFETDPNAPGAWERVEVAVNVDGSFHAENLPPVMNRIVLQGTTEEFLAAATQGLVDILDSGLDLTTSRGEEVMLTVGEGLRIRGQLTRGTNSDGVFVVAWPAETEAALLHRYATAEVSPDGGFVLSALPPGRYRIVALKIRSAEVALLHNPQFLGTLRDRAVTFQSTLIPMSPVTVPLTEFEGR